MTTDLDTAATNVIDLTNNAGAAAVDVQHTARAIRSANQIMTAALRHPGRLAAVGGGMLAVAGVLAILGRSAGATPASASAPSGA
jgi:N-acetylmuramic acid 6-phosphate (MurNAc-6-P) etherase